MIHMQVPFDSGSGRVGVSAGLWVGCSLLNHVSIGMAKPHQNMHTLAASRPLRLQHQVFHSLHTECSAKSSGNLKPIRSPHWSLHSLSTNTSVIFNDIQCNSTIVLYILSFFMSKSVVQCVDLYYSRIFRIYTYVSKACTTCKCVLHLLHLMAIWLLYYDLRICSTSLL